MSMEETYHGDRDYIIKWDSIVLDKNLQYKKEMIAILYPDMHKLARILNPWMSNEIIYRWKKIFRKTSEICETSMSIIHRMRYYFITLLDYFSFVIPSGTSDG